MVRARLAQLLRQILEAVLSLRMWQPPQQPQDDIGSQPQLQTLKPNKGLVTCGLLTRFIRNRLLNP